VGDFGTARTYRLAISEVFESGVPVRQSELLRAHLWAPRHSASSAELAETVGYSSWRTANFQYGALAHRIAIELGVFRPPRGFWVNVLIRWRADHTRSPLGHTRYLLRLEVVRALIDLGFADVPPSPSLSRTPAGRSLGRYRPASGDYFSYHAPSSGALSELERRAMRRR
jgi:hypothetical protein